MKTQFKYISAVGLSLFVLSCATPSPQSADTGTSAITTSEAKTVVRMALSNSGRNAQNLTITKITKAKFFAPLDNQEYYAVCVRWTDTQIGDIYQNGKLVSRAGDPEINYGFADVRQYSGHWGVGNFRVGQSSKIGNVTYREACG